ncbi:hypothetical protein ACEQ8H_005737 [Pleosporales sp. CAS-2024a]
MPPRCMLVTRDTCGLDIFSELPSKSLESCCCEATLNPFPIETRSESQIRHNPMATVPPTPVRTSARASYSCIRCSERKVKCDRQRPCSACTKHNADCVYSTFKSARRQHKRVKVQVLAERIDQYEALLQKHGIDKNQCQVPPVQHAVETPNDMHALQQNLSNQHLSGMTSTNNTTHSPSLQIPTPSSDTTLSNKSKPQDDQEHLKFVENSLWRRVVEESHDPDNIVHHSGTSSNVSESDDEHGFVFNYPRKSKEGPRFPPPDVMHYMWEAFVDNFDPLTKVVHVPTFRPAIEKAIASERNIPQNLQVLMFSIFGAAVLTLKDKHCQERFHETRRSMLSRYTAATEAALSRAKFMATTSLVVLQALVIHIYAVRDIYEPRAVWTLTGIAIRIAQILALDRDGSSLGLSLFDTEIRRRLWWQLKSHDFRAAELCGLAKFRDIDTGAESTKWPSNLDDKDLHPGMLSLESTKTGLTDAAFVACKFEMTQFAALRIASFRKQGKEPSQWNLDTPSSDRGETQASAETLEETIEIKYMRYCDPSQPLHLVLLLVGRYGLNIVAFLRNHPRRWATMTHVPLTERTAVWDRSIKLLEQYNMLLSNPLIERFAWHAPYFQQWHAYIHVLDTLYADPLRSDASKTWQLIESIYENTPELGSDLKKPIHVAIGNLCLRAYSARETASSINNMYLPPTPSFIQSLRRRREVAKDRREARKARTDQKDGENTSGLHAAQGPVAGHWNIQDAIQFPPDSAEIELPSLGLNIPTDPDPFDFFDGFENDPNTYMDLDFGMPEDFNMENPAPEPIDWKQWDTWLANSNVMRPSGP